MIDLLLQIGISNALVAMVLALIALTVGIIVRRPQLTYMLWLLVFIKLVTPPILNFPVPVLSMPTEQIVADDVSSIAGDEMGLALLDSGSSGLHAFVSGGIR